MSQGLSGLYAVTPEPSGITGRGDTAAAKRPDPPVEADVVVESLLLQLAQLLGLLLDQAAQFHDLFLEQQQCEVIQHVGRSIAEHRKIDAVDGLDNAIFGVKIGF